MATHQDSLRSAEEISYRSKLSRDGSNNSVISPPMVGRFPSADPRNSIISTTSDDTRPSSRASTASSRLTREEVSFMNSEELDDFCRQVFTLCDANGDGYITQEELTAQCDCDDPDLMANLMQSMDLNNDGRISFEEFRSGLQNVSKQFTQLTAGGEEGGEGITDQSTPSNQRDNTLVSEYMNGSIYESEITSGEKEEAWLKAMSRLDPHGYISSKDEVRGMWTELNSRDPALLERFEEFLYYVVSDMEKSQSEVEHVQAKIKKMLTDQSREAHEMDDLLQEELMAAYDKQEKKSQEVSDRISNHYQELLEEREALIVSLSEKEQNLRHVLEEKTQTEQELRKERLELLNLTQSLQLQLSDSYKQLSASQRQLQKISQAYDERGPLPWSPGEDPLVESSVTTTNSFLLGSPKSESVSPPRSSSLSPPIAPPPQTFFPFDSPSLAAEVEEAMRRTDTPTERQQQLDELHSDTPTPTIEDEERQALLCEPQLSTTTQDTTSDDINNQCNDNDSVMFANIVRDDPHSIATPVHFAVTQPSFTASQLIPPRDAALHQNSQFSSSSAPSRVFKVVILGDSGVGKTSLIRRLSMPTGDFNIPRSTLGLDYSTALINVGDENVVFQLWDTAGQERFHSTTAVYFRRADAFIVVYDVTNKLTFRSIKSWISLVKATLRSELPLLMIMGNKSDCERNRQVTREEGQQIALELKALFSETSAKSGANVIQAHTTLASLLLERENQDMEAIRRSALRLNKEQGKKCKC